jgi:hypothetical protein
MAISRYRVFKGCIPSQDQAATPCPISLDPVLDSRLRCTVRVVGVAHLSETLPQQSLKMSLILLYFLKKNWIIKLKDNKLDFIYFPNNFINRKGVFGIM